MRWLCLVMRGGNSGEGVCSVWDECAIIACTNTALLGMMGARKVL